MTTLICAGTLFADWQDALKKLIPSDSKLLVAQNELSKFGAEVCQQHFPEMEELAWRPFFLDEDYLDQAKTLLLPAQDKQLFTWADSNNSLLLNFWKTAVDDAKFVLFYSSPEYELSNYINSHPFGEKVIENVITAWVNRSRAMLTFYLNHRKDSLLVNSQSVQSEEETFIQALNKKFDLCLEVDSAASTDQPENSVLVYYLATTLLLNREDVSEIYDEICSAATVICEQDKTFENIQQRNKSLIALFLKETQSTNDLKSHQEELKDELQLKQIQLAQITDELEYYFVKSKEQEKVFTDYLSTDPLLRIARQVRQTR